MSLSTAAAGAGALGDHLSKTELNAQATERESVKIKTLEFFERKLAKPVRTRFAAIVTEVRSTGLFIELTESLTFGFVPVASFGKKRKLAARIRAGNPLEVIVHKVDRFRRTIDFASAKEAKIVRKTVHASGKSCDTIASKLNLLNSPIIQHVNMYSAQRIYCC